MQLLLRALSNLFVVVFPIVLTVFYCCWSGRSSGRSWLKIYVACNIYSVLFWSSKMQIYIVYIYSILYMKA